MNAYKVELLIIDFDHVGADGIKEIIENSNYPNHCISPQVKSIVAKDVEWSDEHPLNNHSTCEQAYKDLFKE